MEKFGPLVVQVDRPAEGQGSRERLLCDVQQVSVLFVGVGAVDNKVYIWCLW
jgi:hypothetical protein